MFTEGNGNGMYMPVAPAYGSYGYGNSGGFFGGDGTWGGLLLGLLFGGLGGWGGFGGFGGGWGGMMGMDAMMLAPYFFNTQTQNEVGRGFDTQNLGNQIASVQASVDNVRTENQISNLQSTVANGFTDTALGIAGVNQNICQSGNATVAAVTGAQNAISQQLFNNEINSLNRSFAEQTANTQAINGVSSQLAKCCCDNQLATVQTQNVISVEAARNREAGTANTQAILDKLCQLELDGVRSQLDAERRENVNLQNQLNMAAFRADNVAQTAALVADNTAQTQYIVNRVAPYPIPAYPVGNPYGYNGWNNGWNNGFGCGCNG